MRDREGGREGRGGVREGRGEGSETDDTERYCMLLSSRGKVG